ncbi:MAG: DUF839 domain-containing protein, partial [Phycisphaerae bacterium]|nr:DUF839 domain-containing protein [Phycisphaerae bacterium]
NREAVAVDAPSGVVYQTEDREDGIFTRFIPTIPGKLAHGGSLQAMAIIDSDSCDTRNKSPKHAAIDVGTTMKIRWIDLDDVESPKDDLRYRGFKSGAARFARAEGIWTCADGIYFACTSGGHKSLGQIWRYRPGEREGEKAETPGRLDLFVEPNDSNLVVNADNLTAAPWGDLIVCEDRKSPPTRLVGVTPEGKLYTFGSHRTNCEFAGAVFSPDGTTMFVNLQNIGVTLAITGPWQA